MHCELLRISMPNIVLSFVGGIFNLMQIAGHFFLILDFTSTN